MKVPLIASLVAAAAVANAVPIRVVVLSGSSSSDALPPFNAGHEVDAARPVADLHNFKLHGAPMMAEAINVGPEESLPVPPVHAAATENKKHHAHPCPKKGKMMMTNSKFTDIANTFRGAFGLPLIEVGDHVSGQIHGGVIHVTSTKVMGSGPFQTHGHPHHHQHHHHHPHGSFYHNSSFIQRLHVALMTLGPWEGRAVAFVLGCGLGVLLRMIFVLAIVTYRSIKGPSEEEEIVPEYTHVIYEYQDDAEEIAVPPPNYTSPVVAVDEEKVPLVADQEQSK